MVVVVLPKPPLLLVRTTVGVVILLILQLISRISSAYTLFPALMNNLRDALMADTIFGSQVAHELPISVATANGRVTSRVLGRMCGSHLGQGGENLRQEVIGSAVDEEA